MFYFIATVLLNVVVSSILKLFSKFDIGSLQAIVVNYITCVCTGILFTGRHPFTAGNFHATWFPWALLMGAIFITLFYLMAYCTRVSGMASMVIANKMSLVIPATVSIWLYHEATGIGKVAGILLALPAVYLVTRTSNKDDKTGNLLWPAILFVMSGGLDTLVNYVQASFLSTQEAQAACTILCFATAAAIGTITVAGMVVAGKTRIEWKNIFAGICLGIPNFFSIYFLVRLLNSNILQSSATIPMLNITILAASSLTAILVFRERADKWRIAGLLLSLIAILLIGFGDR